LYRSLPYAENVAVEARREGRYDLVIFRVVHARPQTVNGMQWWWTRGRGGSWVARRSPAGQGHGHFRVPVRVAGGSVQA
jgi:hypothetical protein